MNPIAYLIILQSFLGAPGVLALDNGAIRIEVDPDLFAVRFIGRPGGENFLDPIYVRDSVRISEGLVDSGGLTSAVEPAGLQSAALSRGPARVIDSGPYHLVLIGPVSEESGLRIRKELRIDPVEPKAWFIVTVLSLKKEAVELSVVNSARLPMGTAVSIPGSEGASFHALEDGIGTLPVDGAGGGSAIIPLSPRVARLIGRWGGPAGGVVIENATGIWIRKIEGALAEAPAYVDKASLVLSIDDEAMRYSVDLRSARADVDSATPLILREAWELKGFNGEAETDE